MAASTGVIFAAYYMLPMVQRIWFDKLDNPANAGLRDLSRREIAVLAPLVVLMIWLGVYPKPVLDTMEVTVVELLGQVQQKQQQQQQNKKVPRPVALTRMHGPVVINTSQLHKR
jgi:NADH-quinone oxidoreductase subunit M